MLRRMKKDVNLSIPEKHELIVRVELTDVQKNYYRLVLTQNYELLRKKFKAPSSIYNMIMQLKKVPATHPPTRSPTIHVPTHPPLPHPGLQPPLPDAGRRARRGRLLRACRGPPGLLGETRTPGPDAPPAQGQRPPRPPLLTNDRHARPLGRAYHEPWVEIPAPDRLHQEHGPASPDRRVQPLGRELHLPHLHPRGRPRHQPDQRRHGTAFHPPTYLPTYPPLRSSTHPPTHPPNPPDRSSSTTWTGIPTATCRPWRG